MHGQGLHEFAVGLATSVALCGLAMALAVAAASNVLGLARARASARPASLGLCAVLIAGFTGAFAVGALDAPLREGAAAVEGGVAGDGQRADLRSDDHDIVTGSIPAGVVYIQAPDMDARFAADRMWKALKAAGFRSPGIELVAGGAPSRPEIRYFDDADRPLADRVAAVAAGEGLRGAQVTRVAAGYRAPRGKIELWYPR